MTFFNSKNFILEIFKCDIASVKALQYRQLRIAYRVLHIACCILRWCKILLRLLSCTDISIRQQPILWWYNNEQWSHKQSHTECYILATVAHTISYTSVIDDCRVMKLVKALLAYTRRFWKFFIKKRIVSFFDRAKSKILIVYVGVKKCRTSMCPCLQEVRHCVVSMSLGQDKLQQYRQFCDYCIAELYNDFKNCFKIVVLLRLSVSKSALIMYRYNRLLSHANF